MQAWSDYRAEQLPNEVTYTMISQILRAHWRKHREKKSHKLMMFNENFCSKRHHQNKDSILGEEREMNYCILCFMSPASIDLKFTALARPLSRKRGLRYGDFILDIGFTSNVECEASRISSIAFH